MKNKNKDRKDGALISNVMLEIVEIFDKDLMKNRDSVFGFAPLELVEPCVPQGRP